MSRQLSYSYHREPALHAALDSSYLPVNLRLKYEAADGEQPWSTLPAQKSQHTVRPRQFIYRAGEVLDGIPVIQDGWAICVTRLADGRRQILSFLLPGDLISANAVFTDRLDFFVEAVTTVTCSYCDRGELRRKLMTEPTVFDAFVSAMLSEKRQADQLATDLGRRSASERIARLVLYLKQRLEMRGLVHDNSFEIPLRQQHIADATGLTPVHVNRVLGAFRNDGVIETSDGKLKIISLPALQRAADIR